MQFQRKQFLVLLLCSIVRRIKIKESHWTVIQSDDDLKTFILYDHAFARISASHQNLTVTLHAVFIQPAVGKPYGAVCLGDIHRLTIETGSACRIAISDQLIKCSCSPDIAQFSLCCDQFFILPKIYRGKINLCQCHFFCLIWQ